MANQGVLIKGKDKQVLIDGAFKKEFEYLDVLPDTELSKIENAQSNYNSIDLILATHVHGDHFNAELTGKHLTHNKQTEFIAPDETITKFKEDFKEFQAISSRVKSVTPNFHESKTITLNGIEIKVFRLEHLGKSPWKEAENVAYLIHIDGKKIIHFGDAKLDEKNLKNFKFSEEEIDVAILPFWQLGPQKQKDIIEKYISPKQILAAHIPPSSNATAQKNIDDLGYKNVIALTKQLKTIVLE